MAKHDLSELMTKRNPLAPREIVQPVDLYSPAAVASEPENQQTDLLANQQVPQAGDGETTPQMAEQKSTPGSTQTSKPVKKFASYLRPQSIKALKMIATQEDRKDYEVLQEAVDHYLKARGVH